MKFSYGLLQDLVEKKLPAPNELADLLTMHSFESDGVSGTGEHTVLDLDILPNRAHDAASHIGVARDSAALLNSSLKEPARASLHFRDTHPDIDVRIENKDLCRRYCVVKIEGVGVSESPAWLKERLEIMGLQPINTIVDIANYVMLITGQPLHAFDYDKIASRKKSIIVRSAQQGETVRALDGSTYNLNQDIGVIADSEGALAIAGIKGGSRSGISEDTKTIVIESANFAPSSIRASSQALRLTTDASWRFERDVPPCFAPLALEIAAKMITDIAGGVVDTSAVDVNYSTPHNPRITLHTQRLNRLLGVEIPEENVTNTLRALEFSIEGEGDSIVVVPPEFRLDITTEYDVYEEIARITGYEKIPATMPYGVLSSPVHRNDVRSWKRRITQEIVSYGFFEIHTVSFVKKEWVELFGMTDDMVWELENPIQDSLPFLRPSLIPHGAITAFRNTRYVNEAVRMFEVGHGFLKQKGKSHEEELVSLVMARKDKENDTDLFYEAKGVITALCDSLGVGGDGVFEPFSTTTEGQCQMPLFHPLQSARISIDNEMVGAVGVLASSSKTILGIKGTVVAAELRLGPLLQNARSERVYQAVSKYPSITRDISLFVPLNTRVADIESILWNATGDVLYDVDMFDYRPIAQDNVLSIAFHLVFQSPERTLLSQEVDEQMELVTKAIQQKPSWEVR